MVLVPCDAGAVNLPIVREMEYLHPRQLSRAVSKSLAAVILFKDDYSRKQQ
jgi:hypothetical protein